MIARSTIVLPQRKVALAVADSILTALALAAVLLPALGPCRSAADLLRQAAALLGTWLLAGLGHALFGVYDTQRLDAPGALAVPAIGCALFTAGLAGTAAWLAAPGGGEPLQVAVAVGGLVLASLLVVRLVHGALARQGLLGARCLVVGTAAQAREIDELLASHPHSGLRVLGLVAAGGEEDRRLAMAPFARLGELDDLDALVSEHRVDHVLLGAGLERDLEVLRRCRQVRYRGAAVLDFVTLYERLAHEISIAHIDDAWLFAAAMNGSRVHARWLKRTLDVVAAALLLLPAALVLLPAALVVKLGSPGRVLFRQERLGLGGRPFMLLKLRTMRADAEEATGPVWAGDDDPRITAAGRALRKYRIDELPQLWNVLVGDMSLVGPRPEREVFARELAARLPLFSERLLVRPGITGWAQVMAPYASTVADSYRKLQFDLYYAKHMSLMLDAVIAVKTVRTMLGGREREQGGMAAGSQLSGRLETAGVPRAAITVPGMERVAPPDGDDALSRAG